MYVRMYVMRERVAFFSLFRMLSGGHGCLFSLALGILSFDTSFFYSRESYAREAVKIRFELGDIVREKVLTIGAFLGVNFYRN